MIRIRAAWAALLGQPVVYRAHIRGTLVIERKGCYAYSLIEGWKDEFARVAIEMPGPEFPTDLLVDGLAYTLPTQPTEGSQS